MKKILLTAIVALFAVTAASAQDKGNWALGPRMNIYTNTGAESDPMTPQGQAAFLTRLRQTVTQTPGGQGIFYWEPALLPLPDGSRGVWQNATLFADDGTALPGLAALIGAAT